MRCTTGLGNSVELLGAAQRCSGLCCSISSHQGHCRPCPTGTLHLLSTQMGRGFNLATHFADNNKALQRQACSNVCLLRYRKYKAYVIFAGLHTLDLSNTMVDDAAISHVMSQSTNIRVLKLSGCRKLTSVSSILYGSTSGTFTSIQCIAKSCGAQAYMYSH